MYRHTNGYMHAGIHTRTGTHTHTHLNSHTLTHHTYVRANTHLPTPTHTHKHSLTLTYIHAYTHTLSHKQPIAFFFLSELLSIAGLHFVQINSPIQLLNAGPEESYLSLQPPPSRMINDTIQFETVDLYFLTDEQFLPPAILFYAGPIYEQEEEVSDDVSSTVGRQEEAEVSRKQAGEMCMYILVTKSVLRKPTVDILYIHALKK